MPTSSRTSSPKTTASPLTGNRSLQRILSRSWGERDIRRPNVVLPTSAHAAFEKGAHYFELENRRIPVRDDWRADVDAMAAAIDDETVLVVGSAPQYPQGVIDPVTEIAALADERSINCHVDACMGGVTLPYLARLGYDRSEEHTSELQSR